eukprot:1146100-Prorocentrum_minimum.AAC.1
MRGPGGGGPAPPRVDARFYLSSRGGGVQPPTVGCEVLGAGGPAPSRVNVVRSWRRGLVPPRVDARSGGCLLYTSDAADDTPCVDL